MKFLKIIFFPLLELRRILIEIIIFWPTSPFGNILRKTYYKSCLKKIGSNPLIESGVRFLDPKNITINNNSIFGRNVNLIVEIENEFDIALNNDQIISITDYKSLLELVKNLK